MKGLETNVVSEKDKKASYGIVYTSWNAEIVQEILLETKKELTGQGVAENKIIIKIQKPQSSFKVNVLDNLTSYFMIIVSP